MVDVSSQSNKVNITVSSSGVSSNVNASGDTSHYYSEKAREWAISNRIVDGVDYSSKYYANKSNQSALNAQSFAQSAQDSYNNFQQSVDGALSTVNDTVQGGIDEINNTKTDIITDIEFVADGEKKEIEELIDTGKDELKEAIGDVKVLTTLEIGDIGFTQMAIDESKGLRRAINKLNNIIIQEQCPELTKRIKATQALDPDLFCTESEWQAELAASPNGVCYKYVIDDEAGTIRLPKYPDYFDLSINTAAKSQTVSVYGTGKALGLYDGTNNAGLKSTSGTTTAAMASLYNKNVGTVASGSGLSGDKALGVVQNASTSGLTGSVTVPAVESEKIKGTYFIQVATGAETEDNIINEIELNNPFSLLDYKYSEYELNNISWLRSEGQYNYKAIYPAVYDLLLKIYNGTETKAGVSVKLWTDESATDYDFRINTADETFRLPIKVKQNFYNALNGNFPVVGNGIALGLTNGSTNYGAMGDNGNGGVMLATNVYGKSVGTAATITTSNDTALGVVTNASYSGLISKISQTEVSGLYLYFYVGETVQNANLVNVGRIQETYTTKSMVDGRWIPATQNVLQNVGMAARTERIIDLSNYLPSDGYAYEVIIGAWVKTGATSGYEADLNIYNELLPELRWITAITRASSNNQASGIITLPVGQERNFTLKSVANYPFDIISLAIRSYRRIGTNL